MAAQFIATRLQLPPRSGYNAAIMSRTHWKTWFWICALLGVRSAFAADDATRASVWIDVYDGEPVAYAAVIDDLASARVVYLGERHTVERHHAMQAKMIADLAQKGVPLVLALEQMESFQQPALDRYNRGEIDFDHLAEATGWSKRWHNYRQYRPALEAARKCHAPVVALSAKSETIRKVVRSGGVDRLDPDTRKELPAELHLHDPLYEKLLGLEIMVHVAATPERLRPMFEAQMARVEAMASGLAAYLGSEQGRGRTAVVLCGSGHVTYGLGTADRLRRRMPGIRDRIVLLSESGDVRLSPAEKAAARPVEITHQQLREIDRPIADYLYVVGLAGGQ